MPLRSVLFVFYFFGSCAGAMIAPMAGVICYIALYHLYPQTTWWGAWLDFLNVRYSFVCGVCLLIGTVLNLHRLPFGRKFVHPVEWGVLGMFLAMLLSGFVGVKWDGGTEALLDKMAKVFLFTFLMSHVVVTEKRLWAMVVALTVLTLYLGYEAKIAPPSAFTRNRLDGIGGPDFRESSGLAVHLFAMLPFIAIAFRQRPVWLKITAFFAACFAVNAILLCQTRSAFVGGVVAGATAVWYAPRRHRLWVGAMLALGVAGGFILTDQYFLDRMMTIFVSADERDASASGRLEIWAAAWRMFQVHPWGVGIARFENEIGAFIQDTGLNWRDAHNSYVLCATETGILGVIFYLGTIALSWRALARARRRARAELDDPDFFELVIFANRLALLVFLASGMFVSRFYTEGAWWLIAMPVCIERAVANEIRVEAREEDALAVEVAKLARSGKLAGLAQPA